MLSAKVPLKWLVRVQNRRQKNISRGRLCNVSIEGGGHSISVCSIRKELTEKVKKEDEQIKDIQGIVAFVKNK